MVFGNSLVTLLLVLSLQESGDHTPFTLNFMYGPKTRAALPLLKQLGGPAQTVLLKAVKENKTLQDKTAWVDLVQQAVKGKLKKIEEQMAVLLSSDGTITCWFCFKLMVPSLGAMFEIDGTITCSFCFKLMVPSLGAMFESDGTITCWFGIKLMVPSLGALFESDGTITCCCSLKVMVPSL